MKRALSLAFKSLAYKVFLFLIPSILFIPLANSESLISNSHKLKVFSSSETMGSYAFNSGNQNEEDSIWSQGESEDSGIDNSEDEEFFKNKAKKKKNQKYSTLPHWGFGLGIAPTTIQVKSSTSLYSLKATNFVIKISYDKPLKKYLGILLGVSLLPITASQADPTLGYAKFEANYTSFEANGRLNLMGSAIQGPWIGGGGSYLFIGRGTSNIVSSSSISSRFAYQLNAGYNASMGAEYLMLRADYYLHPQAQSANGYVKISQMVFSASYFF